MSIARILWIVGLLAAIVLSFINTGQDALIIAVLGLVCGWFVDHEHRLGLLVAAIFLATGGAAALGGIPSIGAHLTGMLGGIGALMSAAGVMAVIRRLLERLVLAKKADS